ncbi:phenylalanine--tRNA ligase subunit beta [Stackebrandtia nassauensis]|uniref:Phenylalanine--tRNA ligase beta subunit n=1 Tax=Stackebrandtia nassauensis (strain DSM 44728 / CIP 108903 / NRRL B-16338 / NBRC 102104 / LLR-40K-21) TaxID=446470 RepID=D3QAE5_STANL|nr:phenylalanine--tRNA ligase subunit beta [Stackebrandtia nassauensis]ADD42728.1 phenylalanyl-tRNA synthetase, beta subunit [Stackebrandtia nassauensis DSM 44728]
MRVPLSWLREYVALPQDLPIADLDAAFVQCGLEVDTVEDLRDNVTGPLVVGTVASFEVLTDFKKPIRYCQVDVGEPEPRGIICGASNFAEGDRVVVALPGAVLPGGFAISARKTYGHVSDGMIASARELGLGEDHSGIMVLPDSAEAPNGADARPVIGLDEVIFELELTPDMSHCFSMRGIAREVAHRLGVGFTDPAGLTTEPAATADGPHPLRVDDPLGCDRFATRAVRGLDPAAASPEWLRRRLIHAGMRPISLAVDVTNYLMLELGQPMHAWDLATLKGTLVVRRAAAGEKLTTLDDVERSLDAEDLVICDDTGPLSLAGIMGGETSEISDSTTDVLMEAAHWDPTTMARTGRRHRLSSEAGKRFERGVDPALCRVAVQRAIDLLVEYGGGTVDASVGDIDNRRPTATIRLAADLPSRIAGVSYDTTRVGAALDACGCTWTAEADTLTVTPPSWRPDMTDQADVVEEVIRLDGYDKVPSVLPAAPPGRGLTPTQRRRRHIGRALASAGYVETLTYPFGDPTVFDALGLPADDPRRQVLTLANPIVDAEPALRTTLIPGLLKALKVNVDRGIRDVGLFETGLVFNPRPGWEDQPLPQLPVDRRPTAAELAVADALRPHQPQHLATVRCGHIESDGWWGPGRLGDWSDAIAAARTIASASGVELEVRQAQHAPWHPGRCAELLHNDTVVGHAGELHPSVCDALEVPRRTCAVEINLDAIGFPEVPPGPSISHYPVALIDVAVVVDATTPAAQVASALSEGAGDLLEDIRLFDVFSGEQLGENRKSLAYKLTFRAPDRTLTADETVEARDRAVALAADRHGAVLRGA